MSGPATGSPGPVGTRRPAPGERWWVPWQSCSPRCQPRVTIGRSGDGGRGRRPAGFWSESDIRCRFSSRSGGVPVGPERRHHLGLGCRRGGASALPCSEVGRSALPGGLGRRTPRVGDRQVGDRPWRRGSPWAALRPGRLASRLVDGRPPESRRGGPARRRGLPAGGVAAAVRATRGAAVGAEGNASKRTGPSVGRAMASVAGVVGSVCRGPTSGRAASVMSAAADRATTGLSVGDGDVDPAGSVSTEDPGPDSTGPTRRWTGAGGSVVDSVPGRYEFALKTVSPAGAGVSGAHSTGGTVSWGSGRRAAWPFVDGGSGEGRRRRSATLRRRRPRDEPARRCGPVRRRGGRRSSSVAGSPTTPTRGTASVGVSTASKA